jgi:hypothetical protein
MLSGEATEDLVRQIEKAILDRDPKAAFEALDHLTYLLEIDAERLAEYDLTDKGIAWRSSVVRLACSRLTYATLRMPEFLDVIAARIASLETYQISLLDRLMGTVAVLSDLSRARISANPLTPKVWFVGAAEMAACRVNLGIACYHLIRLMLSLGKDFQGPVTTRDAIMNQNFDVLFYCLSFGHLPLRDTEKHLVTQLNTSLDEVEQFLGQPQPSIFEAPDLYAVPKGHVSHVLSTIDRVRAIVPKLVQ